LSSLFGNEARSNSNAPSCCIYLDATVGGGGHSEAILKASEPDGRLLGMDLDPDALDIARERLKIFGDRVKLVRGNFKDLSAVLDQQGVPLIDGVIMDLGLSFYQLEDNSKGFSFQADGPLDMRMDPRASTKAWDMVNKFSERQLADLIFNYGEERFSRRISRAIVNRRRQGSLNSTAELSKIIAGAIPRARRPRKIHPATRTFMALRIAVNRELENLENAIPDAVARLKAGGRMAVISFHSLEDRIVKETFRRLSGKCQCPVDLPQCQCGAERLVEIITKKPLTPSEGEIEDNSASRSAKMRVAERLN
jgi:16S rRNA (cytosine1402-N4)-methyltransferase